jgi:aminoglycoside phosphotransferase (APT) family kinase protein
MAGLRTDESRLHLADLADYLEGRQVLSGLDAVDVRVLSGGVSADVFAVQSGDVGVVVKQALGQLKVATTWQADRGRVVVEADALRLAGTIVPGSVPAVYDIDPERYALVIERAPEDFRNWKDDLLAGHIRTDVGARLGTLLATWHSATMDRPDVVGPFGDKTSFVELRIEPFYRSVARRNPPLQHGLSALTERLLASQVCLVHGDFSPKNILTNGAREWVLDWEVAHLGDPMFDLAFLLTHLITKALHRPESATALRSLGDTFLSAYRRTAARPTDLPYLGAHVAALVLARIDGTSPVDYLDGPARQHARRVATSALATAQTTPDEIWEML